MTNHGSGRSPKVLRRIAALLIRSPDARFIVDDLDELFERDVVRGLPRWRARLRYGRNALASALSVRRRHPRVPMLAGASWLNVKLGARMLLKHPGLSVIAVFGIAVAITIGTISFEAVANVVSPALPVPGGERVVSLGYLDQARSFPERQLLHDFVGWRGNLRSIERLGAFRNVSRTLSIGEGPARPLRAAEMTATGFEVIGTPPLMGRTLIPEDEREGAPAVAVIGHDLWQSRFAGSPSIVGQTIHLGTNTHTVIGVMPEGFAFPINHQLWLPFRANPADYVRGEGPALFVFGRLAPGASLEEARTELEVLRSRAAAEHPKVYERLRARVLPFTHEFLDINDPRMAQVLWGAQVLISLLLLIVAVNVAIIFYSRTVARQAEMAVRSALGASRRRVVLQLFVESLVMTAVAGAVGLAVASVGLGRIQAWLRSVESVPFWIDLDLSISAVAYAILLAVMAAVITGVLPGLKATGGRLQAGLRDLGGDTGARLGRTWTFLIVAQVAIAVFLLPLAMLIVWETRPRMVELGLPAEEILTARVRLIEDDGRAGGRAEDPDAFRARWVARHDELRTRMEREARIAVVTISNLVPGTGASGRVEMEDAPGWARVPHRRRGEHGHPGHSEPLVRPRVRRGRQCGGAAHPVHTRPVQSSVA